jgi:hypothetical protein
MADTISEFFQKLVDQGRVDAFGRGRVDTRQSAVARALTLVGE